MRLIAEVDVVMGQEMLADERYGLFRVLSRRKGALEQVGNPATGQQIVLLPFPLGISKGAEGNSLYSRLVTGYSSM